MSKNTFTHMISDAANAAALMPTAFGHWVWEVELDVPLHQEGIVVVRSRQEAILAVVQRQHVVEIYLLIVIKKHFEGIIIEYMK